MTLRRTITISTHAEAARADREANWAKTSQQRLAEAKFPRRQRSPNGMAPRLLRVIEIVDLKDRDKRG